MPSPPPCPPDCPECAELDAREWAAIEAAHDAVLAHHDAGCVDEAVLDAFATGHDDDETARFAAAQLLDDGHSPCWCGGRNRTQS
jgi:alkylhydroperoxidase family enzyme